VGTTFDIESVALRDDDTVLAAGDGVVVHVTPTGDRLALAELPVGFGPVASMILLDD